MALQTIHFDLDTVARPTKLAPNTTHLSDFIACWLAHLSGNFDANWALKGVVSGGEISPVERQFTNQIQVDQRSTKTGIGAELTGFGSQAERLNYLETVPATVTVGGAAVRI